MLFQFLSQSSEVEALLNACIAALPHLPAPEKAVLETAMRKFEADEDSFVCTHCGARGDIENSVQTSVGLVCDACAEGQAVYAAIADWQWQVAEGNTKLGFADWMSHEREASATTSTTELAIPTSATVTVEAINPADQKYVVYSHQEAQDNDGAGFWDHTNGWTTFGDATRFTESERQTLDQPLSSGNDAIWVKLNYDGASDESPPAMHEVFHGHLNHDGIYIDVEFLAPVGATVAERDAAFMAVLAQTAHVDYVVVGALPA